MKSSQLSGRKIIKLLSIIYLSAILLISCNSVNGKSDGQQNENVKKTNEAAPVLLTDTTFTFSNNEIGEIPSGWSQYFTGKGKSTDWKVVDDNGNKVVAQLSEKHPNYHFNEIVYDGFKVKNVEMVVEIKGVKGEMDQGGGFVWRFIDADNYYVVRANPLEDNVVLYKVENGKRTDLPLIGLGKTYGVDVEVLGSGWNTLGLKVVDNIFTVYLNKKQIFQVDDKTFPNAGKIGLWTKADAVTYFDDLQVIKID